MNFKKIKLKSLFIISILVFLIGLGSTYAVLEWQSNNTLVSGDTMCFGVDYTGGSSINMSDMTATANFEANNSASTSLTFKRTSECELYGKGSISVNVSAVTYLNSSSATRTVNLSSGGLNYVVSKNGSTVKSGTITNTGKTVLYDNFYVLDFEDTYTVYFWLDSDNIDNTYLQANLSATVGSEVVSLPNYPGHTEDDMVSSNQFVAKFYYYDSSLNKTTYVEKNCTRTSSSSCTVEVPNSIIQSSSGQYGNAYAGISTSQNSMTNASLGTTVTLTKNTSYYAIYSSAVTYKHYSSNWNTATIYRNSYFNNSNELVSVLSSSSTSTTSISASGGVTGANLVGYSAVEDNTTVNYPTINSAANSNITSVIEIYQISVSYAKAIGIANIGKTTDSCNFTASDTSCTVILPSITVQDGYDVASWKTSSGGNVGVPGDTITLTTTGQTYYATTSATTYNVTYNCGANGGNSEDDSVITGIASGGSVSLNKTCSKSGWTFLGWNTNGSAITNLDSVTVTNSDLTLYAIYKKEAVTYTANTKKNVSSATGTDTSVSCTIAAVYNNAVQGTSCEVNAPLNPYSLSGWTFNGWANVGNTSATTTTSQGGTAVNEKIVLTGNTNLVATWKKPSITYTASFVKGENIDSIGATSLSCTIPAVYNGGTQGTDCTITLPSITASAGYYSGGWSLSGGTSANSNLVPNTVYHLSSNVTFSSIGLQKVYELYNSGGTSIGFANTLTEAVSSVSSDGIVTALIDNNSGAVTVNKNLTLNTNGKKITVTGSITNSSNCTNSSGCIMKIVGNGTITSSSVTPIVNNGTMTLETATVSYTGATSTVTGGLPVIDNKKTFTISSGSIISTDLGIKTTGGNVTMSGGTIAALSSSSAPLRGIYVKSGTVTMTGGVINAKNYGIVTDDNISSEVTLNISGGEIKVPGINENSVGILVKGTSTKSAILNFSQTAKITNTVSGKGIQVNNYATANVTGGTIVAASNGIINSDNNSTLTVGSGNITGGTYGIYVLKGFTTINGGSIVGTSSDAVSNGGGTLTITDGSFTSGSTRSVSQSSGEGTVSGGTYTTTNSSCITSENCYAFLSSGGVFNIDGSVSVSGMKWLAWANGGSTMNYGVSNSPSNSSTDSGFALATNATLNFNKGSLSVNDVGIWSSTITTSTVNINGGSINSGEYSVWLGLGTLNMLGGSLNSSNNHSLLINEDASAIVTGGTISSSATSTVCVFGTLTLGTNNSSVSTTEPRINNTGSEYSVYIVSGGSWNYYDGVLYGKHSSGANFNVQPIGMPSGYSAVDRESSDINYTNMTFLSTDGNGPEISFGKNGSSDFVAGNGQTAMVSSKITATDSSGVASLKYAWSTSGVTEPTNWTSISSGSTAEATIDRSVGYYLWAKATDNVGNVTTKVSNIFYANGWVRVSGTVYKYYNNGSNYTGTIQYLKNTSGNGPYYWYFNNDGNLYLTRGLLSYNGSTYYVTSDATLATSQEINVNGVYYYFGSDGKAVSGWHTGPNDNYLYYGNLKGVYGDTATDGTATVDDVLAYYIYDSVNNKTVYKSFDSLGRVIYVTANRALYNYYSYCWGSGVSTSGSIFPANSEFVLLRRVSNVRARCLNTDNYNTTYFGLYLMNLYSESNNLSNNLNFYYAQENIGKSSSKNMSCRLAIVENTTTFSYTAMNGEAIDCP